MRTSRASIVLAAFVLSFGGCAPAARRDTRGSAQPSAADAERLLVLAGILRAEDRRIVEEGLLAALAHEDGAVRAAAVRAAARIGGDRALPALERALDDPSPIVREEAATGMGWVGASAALGALARSAGDPDPGVRARVAASLGWLADAQAADPLSRLLDDPEPAVRAEAYLAVWRLPDATFAIDRLIAALEATDVVERFGSAYALGRIGAAPFSPPSGGTRAARASRPELERARNALTRLVRAPEAEVRMQAARGLASPSGPSELVAVGAFARDPVAGVRINAIRALAHPGQSIDPDVRRALSDAHPGVARTAIEALGKIGGPKAAEILVKGLTQNRDRRAWIREAAVASLANVAPALARDAIAGLVTDPDPALRAAVGAILLSTRDAGALAAAAHLLADPAPRVRAAMVPAVALAGGRLRENLGATLEDPDPTVRAAVAEAARSRLGRDDLSPSERDETLVIVERLWALGRADSVPEARVAALAAAEAAGQGERTRVLLDDALRSDDWVTRRRAAEILERIFGEDHFEAVGPASERPEAYYAELLRWAQRPRAAIVTVRRKGFNPGRFTIRLDTVSAPLAARNFAALADGGFYDGLVIHRVVANFALQDGDPRGDGSGGPGWTIRDEPSRERFWAGTVGMASDAKDTAGSQWFVTLSAQPHLDGRYTAIGRVVQNLEGVVDQILPGDVVESVRVYEGDASEPLPPP